MSITDTSPEARAIHFEIQRSMSGEQKMLAVFEMSMFARELNRARICHEHPDWAEGEIVRELLRLAFLPKALPSLK